MSSLAEVFLTSFVFNCMSDLRVRYRLSQCVLWNFTLQSSPNDKLQQICDLKCVHSVYRWITHREKSSKRRHHVEFGLLLFNRFSYNIHHRD